MKYIYTQTHSTTACSYLTPQAKMNFTKFTAFLDLEKVLIWVCVMELQTFITYCTHKLPFAVKIQIPITLRLRRRACKARERLNYSSLGLGQGDAHDHHQNHPNKYLPMFIPARKMTLLCFSCSMLPPQHTDSSVAFFHLQPFSQPHSKVSDAFFPFSVSTQVFPARSVSTLPTPFPLLERNSQSAPQLVQATWALRQSQNPKLTNERGRPAYGRTHPCASTLSQKHFVLRVEDVI